VRVTVISWKPFEKGKLVGFFGVRLDEAGIIIRGCCLFRGENGPFVGFPSKAPKPGTAAAWTPHVEFVDKAARDRLQPAILQSLEEFRSRAQDIEGPASADSKGARQW
jgi:DNA-binding cell septation regulator SpoVG